jgi:hypothetical protein
VGTHLEIVGLVDFPVEWEDVAHHHKVSLAATRHLDAVQTENADKQCVRIVFDVLQKQAMVERVSTR